IVNGILPDAQLLKAAVLVSVIRFHKSVTPSLHYSSASLLRSSSLHHSSSPSLHSLFLLRYLFGLGLRAVGQRLHGYRGGGLALGFLNAVKFAVHLAARRLVARGQ